ncbi:hypothetical protein TURU_138585 [Turdus rufiventris]|nr:hypothetical protein TURU_138585 [Turdus rufiventris]
MGRQVARRITVRAAAHLPACSCSATGVGRQKHNLTTSSGVDVQRKGSLYPSRHRRHVEQVDCPHHTTRLHRKPKSPWDLEIIANWPEGENFGLADDEEQEKVSQAEEASLYNQLPADETHYALFTDGSCGILGMNRKWKAAIWSPKKQVAQATEREGGSRQLAELKAVQLALNMPRERSGQSSTFILTHEWHWSKRKYGEARQIDYITPPQALQGKRYILTMVEATTGWLKTNLVPHATARNTILGLEKQVLWRHGTPERIESDNETNFKNSLINSWAREHGIEWVYHIPYHAPAAEKVERCNGLLKTTLKALGGGTLKN